MSSLCCCCATPNRVEPADGEEKKTPSSDENGEVAVDFDSEEDNAAPRGSVWSVAAVFKRIFHASPDSKLALKLYGSKKKLMLERKRQESTTSSRWMIHPCSPFRWYWDILVVFLLVFTVTVLPVSIGFYSEDQLNPEWLSVNIIVDTLFLTDIIVTFRTGVVSSSSPEGVILIPKIVAKKYLKGWFAIDLVSSFPFDYFTVIITHGKVDASVLKASRALRVIRLAKLLSLLKLLRISRLLRFLQRWEDLFDLAGGALRIMKLIMLMLLLAHWNGCVQFLVPYMQGIPDNSWIAINHLQNATVGEQYSWALFKAISHMLCIGFGRWPPQNITEAWLTILSMMVGATFYALFIGNMSTLLLSIDSSGRLYNERLSQVEEYMRYRKLPQNLRQRVQEFYEHRYRKKFFNETAILKELSIGLKEDIITHNCKDLIKSVPFFQNATPEFVIAVLTKLQFEVFLKGEYIIRAGTKGNKMYFIRSGVVDIFTENGEVATSLSDGSHFGEICLLTEDRRVASVVSATIVDLFSLSKKHFQQLLDEYPEMRCALESVALQRLNKIGKNVTSEDIRHYGKITTKIPPPHISKDVFDDKSDHGDSQSNGLDGSYLGSSAMAANVSSSQSHDSSASGRGRLNEPLPNMDLSDLQPSPSPPLPSLQVQQQQPPSGRVKLPPLPTTPQLPPLELEQCSRPATLRSVADPHFIECSDSDSDSSFA